MPRLVAPLPTAFSAYSIWTSFPLGLKVVRENEYCKDRESLEAKGRLDYQ